MARRKRWLIVIVCILAVALGAYASRARIKQAVAAVLIYRVHAFIPPPLSPGESRVHRFLTDAEFYWDIAEIRMAREKRLKEFEPLMQPLVKEINRRQAAGDDMHYSMHIYREIRWRLNFTPDDETTRARIADLRQSLDQPENQKLAGEQQASDGSWGMGIDVWYLRLYYSVDRAKECHPPPRYPLSFLDRINSPEKLDAELDADLRNDFTRTGVFNREELDETFSAIARLLFETPQTGCYAFHPQLKDSLHAFVERWQNPETGCWGQWLVDRQ
jgi:hypothetical protein